jgi:hypothetical protein
LGQVSGAVPGAKVALDWPAVQQIVQHSLASRQGYRPGDLVSRGDAEQALERLKTAGWDVPEKSKLVSLCLDNGHFLVRELRTPAGLAYSRAVARQSLPFDRLDRLSQEPGGQKLIHSIVNLPDGVKLMSPKPTPGFGDLTELLPKQANGRTPKVKDFDRPTGKLYTGQQLLAELKRRWDARSREPSAP